MLKYLDPYPMALEVKGGMRPAMYETVIITATHVQMAGTGTKSKTESVQIHSLHSGTGLASRTATTPSAEHAEPTWNQLSQGL